MSLSSVYKRPDIQKNGACATVREMNGSLSLATKPSLKPQPAAWYGRQAITRTSITSFLKSRSKGKEQPGMFASKPGQKQLSVTTPNGIGMTIHSEGRASCRA